MNAAYAAFDAFGVGDEGKVTVRVVVPAGFEVDALGSDTDGQPRERRHRLHRHRHPQPRRVRHLRLGTQRRRAHLDRRSKPTTATSSTCARGRATPSGSSSSPTQIHAACPQLAELIGRPWPIDERVEVRQAYTPTCTATPAGSAPPSDESRSGEDLDQEVVLHELSHAWFSEGWFADRWINEGLAQVYSNMAVDDLGGTPQQPERHRHVRPRARSP